MERECIYVMRHNELEQVWQYKFSTNGFNHFLYSPLVDVILGMITVVCVVLLGWVVMEGRK